MRAVRQVTVPPLLAVVAVLRVGAAPPRSVEHLGHVVAGPASDGVVRINPRVRIAKVLLPRRRGTVGAIPSPTVAVLLPVQDPVFETGPEKQLLFVAQLAQF